VLCPQSMIQRPAPKNRSPTAGDPIQATSHQKRSYRSRPSWNCPPRTDPHEETHRPAAQPDVRRQSNRTDSRRSSSRMEANRRTIRASRIVLTGKMQAGDDAEDRHGYIVGSEGRNAHPLRHAEGVCSAITEQGAGVGDLPSRSGSGVTAHGPGLSGHEALRSCRRFRRSSLLTGAPSRACAACPGFPTCSAAGRAGLVDEPLKQPGAVLFVGCIDRIRDGDADSRLTAASRSRRRIWPAR
jgi:hypothetical protein